MLYANLFGTMAINLKAAGHNINYILKKEVLLKGIEI